MSNNAIPTRRIVVTGGPGGGKTTAVDLFQREFRKEVAVVPEAATMLFAGGIRRDGGTEVAAATQEAIFCLQRSLETVFAAQYPERVLVCDRGSLDGVAYWPGNEADFFERMGSTSEAEVARYAGVIFFETGAGANGDLSSNNPHRSESDSEAIELDRRLRSVWERHPNFHFVPSRDSFLEKIRDGVDAITKALRGLD